MANCARILQLPRLVTRSSSTYPLVLQSTRCFSGLNRPPPNYEGHVPLSRTERLGLAVGSGLLSFLDPRRGGMELPSASLAFKAYYHRRPHRMLRRGDCPTILHIQASRSHAFEPHGTANP